MANRPGRIKAVIAKDIADIVQREIKNPKIGMVSVNEVRVNDDYSVAEVYVSFFVDGASKEKMSELRKSEGFVRSALSKKVDIYKVPKIVFVADDSFERASSLEKALKKEEETLNKLAK